MNACWIDALEFEKLGTWKMETQFAQEMGQGYLLASDRPGLPVEDCSTSFQIVKEGMYRIWVFQKNWISEYSPGRFRVLVDGVRLPRELGTLPSDMWCWDVAGDINLEVGTHELRIQDTTGWFARFAAVIITDDMDFTPSPEKEVRRRIRAEIRHETIDLKDQGFFDILIAGAGPSGVPCAIQAARMGYKVALISSRPGIGGNASDEAMVGFDGAGAYHPGMRETGITSEIRRIRDHDGVSWEQALRRIVAAEENICVFYNLFIKSADVLSTETALESGGYQYRIQSVTAMNVTNGEECIFRANLFVDSTGDGWLGYYAGAKYRLGRDARWQHNEPQAPISPDMETMTGCLMENFGGTANALSGFLAEDAGHPVPFTAPQWAIHLPDEIYRTPDFVTSGMWWVENPSNMAIGDLWQQERTRDNLIRLALGYFHWLKNQYEKRDLAQNMTIVRFPRYNAKRETRRLIGDYVLTQNDITNARVFKDTIAYCGWAMDIHHAKGIFSGQEGMYYFEDRMPIASIPYRCTYSANVENLFIAGRCGSYSHMALGATRVENTLATVGQAIGMAAALCIKYQLSPRALGQLKIDELQQELLKADASLLWVRNTDSGDLARKAHVSASSESHSEFFSKQLGLENGYDELNHSRDVQICKRENVEFFEVALKNTGPECSIYAELLDLTNRTHENALILAKATAQVPAETDDYVNLPFDPDLISGLDNWGIRIHAQPNVFWKRFDYTYNARMRAKQVDTYNWVCDWANSYVIRFNNARGELADCSPKQVINGISRPMSAKEYAWVSDPNQSLPQYIQLDWDKPVEIHSVRLTFDVDLINPAFSNQALPIVPQTVSDYRVEGLEGNDWQTLYSETGNYLRHRICNFSTKTVSAIRIVITKTWGDRSARVLEVRVY